MFNYSSILTAKDKYFYLGVSQEQHDYINRHIYLSNRYTSFVSLIAIGFLFFNLFNGNYNRVFGNIIEVIIVQSVPLMNYLKVNRLSRVILCITPLAATIASRFGQTEFSYFEYGIMSYVGLFSSIAPLVFFHYTKEKLIFWCLTAINLLYLFGYNFLLLKLSGQTLDMMNNHPYSMLKIPELLLWLGIIVGVMIFKVVGERAEEKEKVARLELEKAHKEVEFLMKQLNEQNELLKEQNQKIEKVNLELEQKVALRTKDLAERNSRLYDYAFMNSHVLRAPVSKIKGLIGLLKGNVNDLQKSQIINYMNDSVEELDKVVYDINTRVRSDEKRQG